MSEVPARSRWYQPQSSAGRDITMLPAPGPEHPDRERASHPRPLRPPGNCHALTDRRPGHQRTAFPPPRPRKQPGGHSGIHARLSGARQAGTRADAACPWPSVKKPTVPTNRPGGPGAVRSARAHRPLAVKLIGGRGAGDKRETRPGRPGAVDVLGLHSGQAPNPGTSSRSAGTLALDHPAGRTPSGQALGTSRQSRPTAVQFAGTWEDIAARSARALSRNQTE